MAIPRDHMTRPPLGMQRIYLSGADKDYDFFGA